MLKADAVKAPEALWLTILKDLRRTANQPTLRELESWSGLSRTHLSRILTGRTLPQENDVISILTALSANDEERQAVLTAVRAARADQRAHAGKPRAAAPRQPGPPGDLGALTEAINRLAAAVEKLADK